MVELEQPTCRICYEPNNLIVPCKCSGTIKYVHKACLDTYRDISNNYSKCNTCNFVYNKNLNDKKFSFYKIADMFLGFCKSILIILRNVLIAFIVMLLIVNFELAFIAIAFISKLNINGLIKYSLCLIIIILTLQTTLPNMLKSYNDFKFVIWIIIKMKKYKFF